MSWKENFSQAVKELMGAPKLVMETAGGDTLVVESRFGRIKAVNPFSRREETFQIPEEPAPVPPPAPTPTPSPAPVTPPPAPTSVPPSFFQNNTPAPAKESTVIAAGTVVQGAIRASGSMDLYGEVYGDVSTKENLKLCGRLEGNATGQDIEINGGRIKGDIIATGRVNVNNNSIVLGNIKAETLVLNGKVKGNLEVKGSLSLDVNAAVAGSVLAGRLSIAEGAILQGDVRISTTDLNKLFAEGEAAGKAKAVDPAAKSAPSILRKPVAEEPASRMGSDD